MDKKRPPGETLEVFSTPSHERVRYRQMKKSLLPLLFLFVQSALADEEALSKCRQIEDISERVSCYDQFADTRLSKESSDRVRANSPSVLAETKATPDAQSLFGTNDAEAKRIVEKKLAIEQIDQIEATVTGVQKSVSKKLTVTLDNGQVWRQLDGKPMRLNSGEMVIVRKASLGSFLMEKKSGGRSIRMKRVN